MQFRSVAIGLAVVVVTLAIIYTLHSTGTQSYSSAPTSTQTAAPAPGITVAAPRTIGMQTALEGRTFIPSSITVEAGDTVNLDISSSDFDYTIVTPTSMGKVAVGYGKTVHLTFPAVQATTLISCRDGCPANVGFTIVVK